MLAERLFVPGLVHVQSRMACMSRSCCWDQSGKARPGLGLDANGEVGWVPTSRDGNRTLALSPDGPVGVKLTDRSGRVLWLAP